MKRIAITGGSGNIAYSLLFRIAHGDLFGKDTPVALHILEVPEQLPPLQGIKMELDDCAFPLLKEVKIGSDPREIFGDIDLVLLIGAKPRSAGMERRDLLLENAKIFLEQGVALNESAKAQCRVLVVGNPCNTNAWIARSKAPKLNPRHFFAMTRLDQNRAQALLAQKAKVTIDEVSHVTIWGNHSATQAPDFEHALVKNIPLTDVILDHEWLKEEFVKKVQQRGAEVIKARGKSSAASAAHAILDTCRSFLFATEGDNWFSLAVSAEGNPYGIREDLIFSFPCRTNASLEVELVSDLTLSPFLSAKIRETEQELITELDQVIAFAR